MPRPNTGSTALSLELPRDFRLEWTLAYLARDPSSRTERVTDHTWEAAMNLGGSALTVRVQLSPGSAEIELPRRRALPAGWEAEIRRRVARRLGLGTEPGPFEAMIRRKPELKPLIRGRRGLRIPLTAEPFESLLWAILGQQITLGFARTLMRRLVELAGEPAGDGLVAPPTPAAVAGLSAGELCERQLSRSKADYLLRVSERLAAGALDLAALTQSPAQEAEATLRGERGLGPWSAHYVMMRGLGFADCVPVGDSGLVRMLARFFGLAERPNAATTLRLMEPFRPYRSLATFHLWQLLEEEISEAT